MLSGFSPKHLIMFARSFVPLHSTQDDEEFQVTVKNIYKKILQL